jgi:hypothetical protein
MYRHQIYLKPDLARGLMARTDDPVINVTTPLPVVVDGLSYVIPGDEESFRIPIDNVTYIVTSNTKRP